jgi:succinate-semialdehyde dehydrogenase / glutarate-semialdehyde dehydrogenase
VPRSLSPRIDSRWLEGLTERLSATVGERASIPVVAPVTGDRVGDVPQMTAEDVDEAAQRAREAQSAWASMPLEERAEILLRFHDLLLDRRDVGLDLIQLEGGKARADALEEILETANVSRYYGRASASILRPRRRRSAIPMLTQAWEYHHPIGVVGIITPWNFPLILGITDALPALVAGSAVVIKLDTHTPYSALWAATLLDEAGLPPDVLQLLTGDGAELGAPLIERVDYLMFTGSTRVGRMVATQCAERLIGCSLELGGKNAMIVLEDADVDRAADGARNSSFSHAGQMCVGMERIFVLEPIYERFCNRFVELTTAMRLGGGFDYDADMGSLLSQQQLDAVSAHVDDAVAKGATVLAGGRARPDLGPFFYEPTILARVTPEMALHADETFGPVVSVYPVASEDEAVERANDSPYGLNFSVWTASADRGRVLARRLEAGTVNVNEGYGSAWCSSGAQMGGFKDSGLGRRHGAHGVEKYTEPQAVAVQRLIPIAGPSWISTAHWERIIVPALRLLRHIPRFR